VQLSRLQATPCRRNPAAMLDGTAQQPDIAAPQTAVIYG
jgi:hypothetical protein